MNRLEKKECEHCHKFITSANMARHKRLKGCNCCKDCRMVITENVKCTRCLECFKKRILILKDGYKMT